MNKLLIGLLIVAAGAGAFFLLRKKKSTVINEIKKEWIIGKWATDAIQPGDSNFSKYRYDFRENGNIVRSLNDSANVDTSYYAWSKNNELVWKVKLPDSTGKVYTIVRLTQDSLQMQSRDSVMLLFTKLK